MTKAPTLVFPSFCHAKITDDVSFDEKLPEPFKSPLVPLGNDSVPGIFGRPEYKRRICDKAYI